MKQELYEVIFRGLQAKYPGQPIGPRWRSLCATLDGGEGSGNFGYEGRPGKVGGSGEGGEAAPDKHKRKGVKSITKFEVPFILQIGTRIQAFNTKFTVREFENGRRVLAPELLEINKGKDFSLYAMSTKVKET